MGDSLAFGCPECGRRIDLDHHSPGRRVRCRRCRTLVEVPFFPRRFGRRRQRRSRWRGWLPIGLMALAVLGLPTLSWLAWRASVRSAYADELRRSLATLERFEPLDDPGSAFRVADDAWTLALEHGLDPPGGLDHLAHLRHELARRDVRTRLDALPSRPPEDAFQEALTLLDRTDADPALASLRPSVAEALSDSARRWAEVGLLEARRQIDSSQLVEALVIAERLTEAFNRLPSGAASGARALVRDFSSELIGWLGARIAPIDLTQGPRYDPSAPYDEVLVPRVSQVLADRGYLVEDPASPLADLWESAPFQFRVTITELDGSRYLQSPNRTTIIAVSLDLERVGKRIWCDYFEARTSVSLPGLGAMAASRFALGHQPHPEIERRLYQDARRDLLEKLDLKLLAVPSAPVLGDR